MKLILLPGYSLKNRQEMSDIGEALKGAGYTVYVHEWRHWIDENATFDISTELADIMDKIPEDGEFGLITKSIGGYVGVNLINTEADNPKFAIFMGVGTSDLEEQEKQDYRDVLARAQFPKTFIQNKNDNHGTSAELKEMLGESGYRLIEKDGDNHRYNYPNEVITLVNEFVQ